MYEPDTLDAGWLLRHGAFAYLLSAGLLLFVEGVLEIPLPVDNVLVVAVFLTPVWLFPAMIFARGAARKASPTVPPDHSGLDPFRRQPYGNRASNRRSGLSRLQIRLLARAVYRRRRSH